MIILLSSKQSVKGVSGTIKSDNLYFSAPAYSVLDNLTASSDAVLLNDISVDSIDTSVYDSLNTETLYFKTFNIDGIDTTSSSTLNSETIAFSSPIFNATVYGASSDIAEYSSLPGRRVYGKATTTDVSEYSSILTSRVYGLTTKDVANYSSFMSMNAAVASRNANYGMGYSSDANTLLLCHCEASPAVDSSSHAFTLTKSGSGTVSLTTGQVGTYSLLWSNSGGAAFVSATNSAFAVGTGDFTVDLYMMRNNTFATSGLLSTSPAVGTYGIMMETLSGGTSVNIGIGYPGTIVNGYSFTPTVNVWYHISFQRKSNVGQVWINGTSVASGISWPNSLTGNQLSIGSRYATGTSPAINIALDEIRVSNVARYTS